MAEGNSVFDEIRAQHKKMKGKSLKEKAAYFWEYYRVATIVAILVIAFAANLIYTIVTAKDSAFHGVLINGYTDIDATSFMEGFESFAQIDTNKYSTSLETNFTLQQDSTDQYTMANIQKFAAMVAAKELDVVIIDPDTFATYADGGYFYNLNDLLSDEMLNEYEDRLIYYDIPEDGQEDVPAAIRVTDVPFLQETQAYAAYEDAYLAVIVNTQHPDTVISFLEYLEQPFTISGTESEQE